MGVLAKLSSTLVAPLSPHFPLQGRNVPGARDEKARCCSGLSFTIPPTLIGVSQRRENPVFNPKVRVVHVLALSDSGQIQGQIAKFVGSHKSFAGETCSSNTFSMFVRSSNLRILRTLGTDSQQFVSPSPPTMMVSSNSDLLRPISSELAAG
jgi:hypothetical protein